MPLFTLKGKLLACSILTGITALAHLIHEVFVGGLASVA